MTVLQRPDKKLHLRQCFHYGAKLKHLFVTKWSGSSLSLSENVIQQFK